MASPLFFLGGLSASEQSDCSDQVALIGLEYDCCGVYTGLQRQCVHLDGVLTADMAMVYQRGNLTTVYITHFQ